MFEKSGDVIKRRDVYEEETSVASSRQSEARGETVARRSLPPSRNLIRRAAEQV